MQSISNNETKFWHVWSALDAKTSTDVHWVISAAATCEKYAKLKQFLLKTFPLSSWERAERMLAMTKLGDRKPSPLVNYLAPPSASMDLKCSYMSSCVHSLLMSKMPSLPLIAQIWRALATGQISLWHAPAARLSLSAQCFPQRTPLTHFLKTYLAKT